MTQEYILVTPNTLAASTAVSAYSNVHAIGTSYGGTCLIWGITIGSSGDQANFDALQASGYVAGTVMIVS